MIAIWRRFSRKYSLLTPSVPQATQVEAILKETPREYAPKEFPCEFRSTEIDPLSRADLCEKKTVFVFRVPEREWTSRFSHRRII
jgi:hypothetical protein